MPDNSDLGLRFLTLLLLFLVQDNPTSAYVTRTGVSIVAAGFYGVFEAFTCSWDWTLAAETRVWMAGRVGSIAERLGLQEMRRV